MEDIISNLGIKLANESILSARLQAEVNRLTNENTELKKLKGVTGDDENGVPDPEEGQA